MLKVKIDLKIYSLTQLLKLCNPVHIVVMKPTMLDLLSQELNNSLILGYIRQHNPELSHWVSNVLTLH